MSRPKAKNVRLNQGFSVRSRSSSPDFSYSAPVKKAKSCPNPECDGTKTTEEGGQLICVECGAVVSDKQLTQDVQFGEAANGQAIVQGVHVGEGQETARPAPGSSRVMGGTASKDIAVGDARRELTRLAANPGWNIRQHDIEKAERVFKLAYNYGHTKGRDRTHICAVCLYIAVRQRPSSEGTLMLIDFADFVNVSVFYLGRLYTELCAEIRINHEATVYQIRPELLAHRFCEELGFGSDTYKIATEAVSIIKRMNRDWLVRGRRPSGIVGAAVILAARMNNYRRTVRELVYTAKVCEYTITKRLDEFRCTPISKLTVSEVRRKEWDKAAPEPIGPPAMYPEAFMTEQKRKRKRKSRANATEVEAIEGSVPKGADAISEASPKQSRKKPRSRKKPTSAQAEADRQAMPPPTTANQLNIDPQLLRASSQALRDIGDDENAQRLEQRSSRKNPAEEDDDADVEENIDQRRASNRRKKPPRPLPEPSAETIADEEQLEADINAQLRDADMLEQAGRAHDDTAKAPLPPDPDENETRTDYDMRTEDQDDNDADESDYLDKFFGVFHPSRPEYEDEDGDAQSDLPVDEQWTSLNHQDIQDKYKETIKHTKMLLSKYPTTSASLLEKVPDSEIIPEEEFADDPDVNDMILDEEEVKAKEAFWISRYGKHLKERHLKKVQKLIDEENGTTRQPRKRNSKKPKPGDDSGYQRDEEGKVGNGWVGALKATFEHRGSSKLNYQAIGKILDSGAPSTTSVPSSRRSSVSLSPSVGTGATSMHQPGTPGRASRPVRMPRLPKDGKIPEAYAKRLAEGAAERQRVNDKAKASAQAAEEEAEDDDDGEEDEDENEGDYVQRTARGGDDDEDEEEDEDDDDDMVDMSNLSEAVQSRIAAGMSLEEAIAADSHGRHGL